MLKGIHPATSQSWGSEACARLCQIIVESNHGLAQQVVENRTDLMDLCTLDQLEEPDDIGLKLSFLAVYYDQPDILKYLHKRGVDLTKPCDPLNFGNPMFYAVSLQRLRLVTLLDSLFCSVSLPCDIYNQKPIIHAERINDQELSKTILDCSAREMKAKNMFTKNFLKLKQKNKYNRIRMAIIRIQKIMRGALCRMRIRKENIIRQRFMLGSR